MKHLAKNYSNIFFNIINKIKNNLLHGSFILFFSCQSDPVVLNPPGSYEYNTQKFKLDIDQSYTLQGQSSIGKSPRLYSGIINNQDTVLTFIKFDPELLDSHQVCIGDSLIDVKLELTTVSPIAVKNDSVITHLFIEPDSISAYLVVEEYYMTEDSLITDKIIKEINSLSLVKLSVEINNNNSILISILDNEPDLQTLWCENKKEIGILISYSPIDNSYLEFYSSDAFESNLGPKLEIKYAANEQKIIYYNQYYINSSSWVGMLAQQLNNGPYFVNDTSLNYWGTFYVMDLDRDNPIISNPSSFYNSISIQSDTLISQLVEPTKLFEINIEINPNIAYLIDTINFSIQEAFAYKINDDLSGDNWSTLDTMGTENNNFYDIIDENENGEWDVGEKKEKWLDYGEDNCPDIFETGNPIEPCDSILSNSIYNLEGTEGNNILDWIDNNGDGVWNDGIDSGEEWQDVGQDGCADKYENGDGACLLEPSPDWVEGLDANSDNYSIDPFGDDWSSANLDGTEGNGKWDQGESFKDWGSDGLSELLVGYQDANNSENNGEYDFGEPFDDFGSDNVKNYQENGYNNLGTEGNGLFDGDGEFKDCGIDNCCDSDNNCDDISDDNYNIDPNNDNYGIDSTLTEGNLILDWEDKNEDGIWNLGEGEQWFDWGTDHIPDSLELFQQSSILPINIYENNYIYDISNELFQYQPNLIDTNLNLWISSIKKINSTNYSLEISIQNNVPIAGLQFKLSHLPFIKTDTIVQINNIDLVQFGADKIFKDFSLLARKEYNQEDFNEKLLINYSNDIYSILDFDSLDIFLSIQENIISNEYTEAKRINATLSISLSSSITNSPILVASISTFEILLIFSSIL